MTTATAATTKMGCLIAALSKRALNPLVSAFNVWFPYRSPQMFVCPCLKKAFRKQALSEQFEWRAVKLAASVEPRRFLQDERWSTGKMFEDRNQRAKPSRRSWQGQYMILGCNWWSLPSSYLWGSRGTSYRWKQTSYWSPYLACWR